MLARFAKLASVGRAVVSLARDEEVTFLAASVAYYAFVSLVPAVLLALVVASIVGGDALTAILLAVTDELLTSAGQEAFVDAIGSDSGRSGATVVGVVVLVWGGLKVFRALDVAFSKIYGSVGAPSLLDQLTDSVVVAVGVGLTLVVMFVVGGVLAAIDLPAWLHVAGFLGLPVVLVVAFLPMYYRFPDTPISVGEALPGAIFAAVGWTLLQAGFQLYAASVGIGAYGLLGGVLLFLTWLYAAGFIVILGAAVNAVLGGWTIPDAAEQVGAHPTADRQVQHEPGPASAGMEDREPRGAPDVAELSERVEELRADLDAFEDDVEERTVDRPRLEAELKEYVRRRMRDGHARGWGPYLVLLYGVVLALGAFYLLDGWAAVAAMVITTTSTLGLYVLFLVVGAGIGALDSAGNAAEFLRRR